MLKISRQEAFNPLSLEAWYPSVVKFKTIIDYINWNPIVVSGEREVRKAGRVWSAIEDMIVSKEYLIPTDATVNVKLGGVFSNGVWEYLLLSDMEPRIPYNPKYICLVKNEDVRYCTKITNRKLYIKILRALIRATVVKK